MTERGQGLKVFWRWLQRAFEKGPFGGLRLDGDVSCVANHRGEYEPVVLVLEGQGAGGAFSVKVGTEGIPFSICSAFCSLKYHPMNTMNT